MAAWAQVLVTGKQAIDGIKGASSGGGSTGGSVPGVSGPVEIPAPSAPVEAPRETRSQTVIIQGTILGTREFVEEQLAPLIAAAAADNVDFNLVTKVEGEN